MLNRVKPTGKFIISCGATATATDARRRGERTTRERERERLAVGGSGARGGLVRRGARGEQSGGWGKREMELEIGRAHV